MFNGKVEVVNKKYNNFLNKNLKEHPKPLTWSENLRYYFRDYCECSGVHGVRYLGERGRYMIEKLAWTIVITLVCYFCTYLILKAYNKWTTSPVIVTFATQETAISQIPFPAVTVCPEVKHDSDVFNYTDVILKQMSTGHITPNEERYFEALSLICDGFAASYVEALVDTHLTVCESAVNAMIEVLPDLSNYTAVYWLGHQYEFNSTLSQTFTSEGVCYSFNMLHFDDILVDPQDYVSQRSLKDTQPKMWTLEDGYLEGHKIDTFPARTFMSGISGGFLLDIFIKRSHVDYFCKDSLQGFKVTLHHPSELPNMDRHFRLPLDQVVLVAIKPRMITVSEGLKSYKPEARGCYFANERKLTYFRRYTQRNCLDECLSNYTLAACGCIPFYMPISDNIKFGHEILLSCFVAEFNSSPICGPRSRECFRNSRAYYLSGQLDISMNSSKNKNHASCNCLPACSSLEYDVETSQTDWDSYYDFTILDILSEGQLGSLLPDIYIDHMSKLQVYYPEMQFLALERHEVYGLLDFISNMGGLLGLFIGFSFTSVIEIVYFLTLRLACNMLKFGNGFWSGQRNISNQ